MDHSILQQDIEELRKLLGLSQRDNIKNMLKLEIDRLETSIAKVILYL